MANGTCPVKRLSVRRQKHAHRPPPTSPHPNQCRHINLVHIRPFLTVHFNRYKMGIQHIRHILLLKRIMFHKMTPVTCRIPNRQKDRLILPPSRSKRRLPPRIPPYRIIRMLQQIRTRFTPKPIPPSRRQRDREG